MNLKAGIECIDHWDYDSNFGNSIPILHSGHKKRGSTQLLHVAAERGHYTHNLHPLVHKLLVNLFKELKIRFFKMAVNVNLTNFMHFQMYLVQSTLAGLSCVESLLWTIVQ